MRTPTPLQTGDLIAGKYRIESELGRGGMGAVFAVRHVATGRRFAVKLLNAELSGNADAEARFLREAMLASSINHPSIVEVYDVGREGDTPYMVMKLLEGETLADRLKHGPLPADEVVTLLLPVLHGITAAHGHGIIHRDLKPENIMLARDSGSTQPKILDFGVSKLLSADARTRLTLTGMSIGTPLYMSPEQVRGDVDVDARTDVYALGVILYQALTGAMPFDGNNYADLVVKIVMGNAPGIRAWNANLPRELEAVVARAMSVERAERHANVAELAADLGRFRGVRASNVGARVSQPRASAAATPFAAEASARPPAPRNRLPIYAAAAFGVAALVAALLWTLWPASPEPVQRSAASAGGPTATAPAQPAPVPAPAAASQPAAPSPPAAPSQPAASAALPAQPREPVPAAPHTESRGQPASGPVTARPHESSAAEVERRARPAHRTRAEQPEPAEAAAEPASPPPSGPRPASEIIDPFQ